MMAGLKFDAPPERRSMSNRIAFNPQDRFVVSIGSTLVVTTNSGDTFGHDITGHTADRAFQFAGAKAAFNPVDRFVTTIGSTLIVITRSGDVFGHDVSGRTIGPGFKFAGSRAAFNEGDRFVVTIGNTLIVITRSGDVFGHDVAGRTIGPGFKFAGSKAAFNPGDRFVVTVGNTLIVTTLNGDVFGHDVSGRTIGPPFAFSGSRMAFNPEDRFVVMVGNTMNVTTQGGPAFGADVVGRNIGAIFRLNPDLCVRLHLKVWTTPNIAIQTMLTRMQDLFGTAGIGVVVASREDFIRHQDLPQRSGRGSDLSRRTTDDGTGSTIQQSRQRRRVRCRRTLCSFHHSCAQRLRITPQRRLRRCGDASGLGMDPGPRDRARDGPAAHRRRGYELSRHRAKLLQHAQLRPVDDRLRHRQHRRNSDRDPKRDRYPS
jgi:hypothetical protein